MAGRAWPGRCTDQPAAYTGPALLTPYHSVFPRLFLPKSPSSIPLPTFGSSVQHPMRSLVHPQTALPHVPRHVPHPRHSPLCQAEGARGSTHPCVSTPGQGRSGHGRGSGPWVSPPPSPRFGSCSHTVPVLGEAGWAGAAARTGHRLGSSAHHRGSALHMCADHLPSYNLKVFLVKEMLYLWLFKRTIVSLDGSAPPKLKKGSCYLLLSVHKGDRNYCSIPSISQINTKDRSGWRRYSPCPLHSPQLPASLTLELSLLLAFYSLFF